VAGFYRDKEGKEAEGSGRARTCGFAGSQVRAFMNPNIT
jgi:hypothetical protein